MRVHKFILVGLMLLFLAACTTIGSDPNPYLDTSEGTQPSGITDFIADILATQESTELPTSQSSPTPSATATLHPATYYFFDPGINPLTGLPAAEPANLDRCPVMVKVSNWPREGRPHAGLSQADIVFEYFIGHQMNRFLAIYYGDNASVIGPVRSGRLVDAQLTNLYQGILAYGDADPQVDEVLVETLGARALAFKYLPCPPMCGLLTHSATGVYADSTAMTAYAVDKGLDNTAPDLRGLYFQSQTPAGDAQGTLLRVEYANFSIMEWRYSDDTGDYRLWQEAQVEDVLDLVPMTDRNTDEPIAFENLVVMVAEYIEYAPSLHDITIQDVRNPQPAIFYRDGVALRGTWRVPEPDRPIIFELDSGESVALKPGQTWVVIVGQSSTILEQGGDEWLVEFGL